MKQKRGIKGNAVVLALLLSLAGAVRAAEAEVSPAARELLERTIRNLGGESFLNWAGYHGEGRSYVIKGDNQSWTQFWYDYRWPGMERMAYEEERGAIVEVWNTPQGKGWAYEYGKVKEQPAEEFRRYQLSEKRSFLNLFRERWKESGMKVFHLGPESFDGIRPEEALEFTDAENYTVTVVYDQGQPLPSRIEYIDKTREGRTEKHADQFFKWFRFQGVFMPLRIEFYVNGMLRQQIEFATLSFASPLPAADFGAPKEGPMKEKKKKKHFDTAIDRDEPEKAKS